MNVGEGSGLSRRSRHRMRRRWNYTSSAGGKRRLVMTILRGSFLRMAMLGAALPVFAGPVSVVAIGTGLACFLRGRELCRRPWS